MKIRNELHLASLKIVTGPTLVNIHLKTQWIQHGILRHATTGM